MVLKDLETDQKRVRSARAKVAKKKKRKEKREKKANFGHVPTVQKKQATKAQAPSFMQSKPKLGNYPPSPPKQGQSGAGGRARVGPAGPVIVCPDDDDDDDDEDEDDAKHNPDYDLIPDQLHLLTPTVVRLASNPPPTSYMAKLRCAQLQ